MRNGSFPLQRALALAALSLMTISATGCAATSEAPPQTPPASSLAVDSPDHPFGAIGDGEVPSSKQLKQLAAATARFNNAPGFALRGAASADSGMLGWEMVVSTDGAEWKGTVELPGETLEILHTQATTWVGASEDYWTLFGLDEALATKAGANGNSLVFSREVPVLAVAYVDVSAFVQAIKLLDPASATRTHVVDDKLVYTVPGESMTTWIQMSTTPSPELLALGSVVDGSQNVVSIAYLESAPTFALPSPGSVVGFPSM